MNIFYIYNEFLQLAIGLTSSSLLYHLLSSPGLVLLTQNIHPAMSPRKKEVLSAVTATADTRADEPANELRRKTQLERIPQSARFVLAVLSSLVLSAGFFSLTSGDTLGELGAVSRHLEAWWEVGGLTAWKAMEVGLAWVLGFDGEFILLRKCLYFHAFKRRLTNSCRTRRVIVHLSYSPPHLRTPGIFLQHPPHYGLDLLCDHLILYLGPLCTPAQADLRARPVACSLRCSPQPLNPSGPRDNHLHHYRRDINSDCHPIPKLRDLAPNTTSPPLPKHP